MKMIITMMIRIMVIVIIIIMIAVLREYCVKLEVTTRNVVFLFAYLCIARSAFHSIEHC